MEAKHSATKTTTTVTKIGKTKIGKGTRAGKPDGRRRDRKKTAPAPAPAPATASTYQPKTELGKKIWELHLKIVASGEPLLDIEGVRREVTERRGGVEWRELEEER